MEITSIFVIIAAILVFIILILALVYWKMSLDEKNGKKKNIQRLKNREQNNKLKSHNHIINNQFFHLWNLIK